MDGSTAAVAVAAEAALNASNTAEEEEVAAVGVVHVDVCRGDTTAASPLAGTTCAALNGETSELSMAVAAVDLLTLSVPYFFCATPNMSLTALPFSDDEPATPLERSFFSVLYLAC